MLIGVVNELPGPRPAKYSRCLLTNRSAVSDLVHRPLSLGRTMSSLDHVEGPVPDLLCGPV
jgi:hypothetical protein